MKSNHKKIWQWLKFIFLGGVIAKILFSVFKKDAKKIEENFEDFLDEEKKEVEELATGKESFKKYFKDTCSIFKVYFIPAGCNEYKPKILRTKSLAIIAVILILFKALIVSYLFFIYPNVARMSEMISQEVYNLVNNERMGNDLNTLIFNDKLNIAAQAKANDMIKNNYFAHKSPDGKMPWDWIDRNQYAYLYAGENLAMNFTSAFSAHQALIMSESHKKNILNIRYSDIGIAVVKGVINGRETNILVELFGSAKSAVKPALAEETINENQNIKIDENKQVVSKEKQLEVLSSETKNNAAGEDLAGEELPGGETSQSAATTGVIAGAQGQGSEQAGPVPNEVLASNLSGVVSEVKVKNYHSLDFIGKFIFYSQYLFLAALVIMTLLLLINIFVKISVQHKPVIVQTLLVIVMIISLLSVKIHFLEGISQKIIIF